MRYQFKVESDDSTWVLDMVGMRWGRVSDILGAPSVKAAEHDTFTYNLLEEGNLIPQGGGVYSFEGRTSKTGNGLCSVGILAIPYEDTLQLYLRANVMLKEDSFKSQEIKTIKHHIIQANRPVPSNIVQMPEQPLTVEEAAQPKE